MHSCLSFLSPILPPPSSTLFPYTTLFRSPGSSPKLSTNATGRKHRIHKTCGLRKLQCKTRPRNPRKRDRKSTRLNSSHVAISYAVFCLKKKKKKKKNEQKKQ